MKEGFYWYYYKMDNEWTIAKYMDKQWWFIGGDEGSEKLNEGDIIGDKIERINIPVVIDQDAIKQIENKVKPESPPDRDTSYKKKPEPPKDTIEKYG